MRAEFARADKALKDAGLDGFNVEVVEGERGAGSIKTGQVLDAGQRVRWATEQIKRLSRLIDSGTVKRGDRIHLDDFYHPGLDGLWYMLDLHCLHLPVTAYCWAQSVDQHDFTYRMRDWMRGVEQAHGSRMQSIFVADPQLKELLVAAGVGKSTNVRVVGLPFNSCSVSASLWGTNVTHNWTPEEKKKKVVFSSRFDAEKDPIFFLQVAERVWANDQSVEFVMCTSAPEIRSNNRYVLEQIDKHSRCGIVQVRTGLSKKDYYQELATARVQFNSALQDWVSFTLLEAVTFGCWPVYPMYRSFPLALRHDGGFLYRPNDLDEAALMVEHALHSDAAFTDDAVRARQDLILNHHDNAIFRMTEAMGLVRNPSVLHERDDGSLARWKQWRDAFCAGLCSADAPPDDSPPPVSAS